MAQTWLTYTLGEPLKPNRSSRRQFGKQARGGMRKIIVANVEPDHRTTCRITPRILLGHLFSLTLASHPRRFECRSTPYRLTHRPNCHNVSARMHVTLARLPAILPRCVERTRLLSSHASRAIAPDH